MPVNTTKSSKVFLGNGSTVLWDCDFRIFQSSDVAATIVNPTTGDMRVLSPNTEYTVSGANDDDGFQVTTALPVDSGMKLLIERDVPYTQPTSFTNQSRFFPILHQDMADRLSMQIQQLSTGVNNSLSRPNEAVNYYDLEGNRMANVASGLTGTDAANLAQVISLLASTTITNSPFIQAGTGAVTRSMLDKNQETVSVLDFGADKTGVADSTTKIQAALDTGKSVYIPDGIYIVQQLVLSSSSVRIYGSGLIKKKANVDGMCLRVTGSKNLIDGLRFDATAPQPSVVTTNDNDVLRIEGSDNIVRNCYINGSKGGGIAILNSARNQILFNTILNVFNNSILVANLGADDNLIMGNYCDGTGVQNNIFLSARTSGIGTTDYIYRNRVISNTCKNSGDTAIEMGQHNRGAIVQGNYAQGAVNPPILIRDSLDWLVTGNVIECGAGATDGIAVVPQGEAATFPARGIIANNRVTGIITRSFIYVGNYDTKVLDNYISDTITAVNAGGTNMVGIGIAVAGSLNNIEVRGNSVDSVSSGIATNLVAASLDNFVCNNNSVKATIKALNFDSTTFTNSQIKDNVINRVNTSGINMAGTTTGSLSTLLSQNSFSLTGFTGATPVKYNATFSVLQSFLHSETEKMATVPVTQFDYRVLVPTALISCGVLTLEFASGEFAILSIYQQGGTGDGNSYASIVLHGSIVANTAGSSNWGLTKTAEGILLQRRGSTIAAYGSMKWRFDPVTAS